MEGDDVELTTDEVLEDVGTMSFKNLKIWTCPKTMTQANMGLLGILMHDRF